MKKLVIGFLLGLILLASLGFVNAEIDYSCSEDSDCVKVQGGYCGCGAGGNATTINKNSQEEWMDKWRGMACLAVMSEHHTCFEEAKCVSEKCELVEKEINYPGKIQVTVIRETRSIGYAK